METTGSLNFVEMIKAQLEHELRGKLVNDLTDKLVAEFREEAQGIVKTAVDRVSLDSVEMFKDLQHIRDELRVCVTWRQSDT